MLRSVHSAEAVRAEHARQRRDLEALCAWVRGDAETALASELQRLAYELLEDIDREERQVLTAEALRRGRVLCEQPVS